jgi:regulation of enolase protein 1 (concanavalin A-like superfamily)
MTDNVIFEETFDGGFAEDWGWLREESTASRVGEGVLHLRSLPGTLWGETNTARNFLLRPAQKLRDGLAAEVTVTNHPELRGEQGGLIWYIDDDNYVKFIKECLEGSVWIVLAREEEAQSVLVNKLPVETESARLRLALVDGKMVGQFRTADDGAWQVVGECAPVEKGDVQLGVYTHGGPADEEHWAELRDFRVLG